MGFSVAAFESLRRSNKLYILVLDLEQSSLQNKNESFLFSREDEHVPLQRPAGGRRHEEEHDGEF